MSETLFEAAIAEALTSRLMTSVEVPELAEADVVAIVASLDVVAE